MAQTATVQIEMPEMGESVTEGIVLEWHVAVGDFVNEGDTVVEVSTDKVDAEVPAPADGVITKLWLRLTTRFRGGPVGGDGTRGGLGGLSRGAGRGLGDACRGLRLRSRLPQSAPPAESRWGCRDPTEATECEQHPVARRVAEANGVDLGSVAVRVRAQR